MIVLRALATVLFLFSAVSHSWAQLDLDAIEGAAGSSLIEHLKKSTQQCNSAFISALNSRLFDGLISKRLISKLPEVYIFNFNKINAFAAPSGKIVLTPALLGALRSGDEYAGVIFHEVGHVALGHLRQFMIIEAARSLMFSSDATEVPALLARLSYSRTQEVEADEFAAKAMLALGISPTNFGSALLRISTSGNLSATSDVFSDHPLTADRVKRLNNYQNDEKRADNRIELPAWRGIDLSCR